MARVSAAAGANSSGASIDRLDGAFRGSARVDAVRDPRFFAARDCDTFAAGASDFASVGGATAEAGACAAGAMASAAVFVAGCAVATVDSAALVAGVAELAGASGDGALGAGLAAGIEAAGEFSATALTGWGTAGAVPLSGCGDVCGAGSVIMEAMDTCTSARAEPIHCSTWAGSP